MTMLDTMRRHKGWLKWSLGIVGVTFVWFYVPSFFQNQGSTAPTAVLASVNGRDVLVGAYQRVYQQQVNSFRASAGGNFDENLLKQLNIPYQLIMRMVDSEAVLAEAARLGVTVSDAELGERIQRMQGFQENGHFIGSERYEQIIKNQRPPMSPPEFEEQIREQLVVEKLQALITGWMRVSDTEVDQEYKKRNEKVKVELAVFTAADFQKNIQPTDAELTAEFNAHPDTYRVPEKRRVRFLAIDSTTLRSKVAASAQEIEARYQANIKSYSTPEQVKASHILLKTEGKDDATVKKQAEAILEKAKKPGADFAALAKQYSEDGSKEKGGDLDYFPRGKMVKPFEDAAWGLSPGQISGLVKSEFGYHIIKVTGKKPASLQTLADVRSQLENQIKEEKAQAEAQKMVGEVAGEIKQPSDLDRVARGRGLSVGDSGLFAREEPLAGLGFVPDVANSAYTLKLNEVSKQLATNQGFVFIALVDIKPPYLPKLEEVKSKVKEEVVKAKAVELARTKATTMAQAAKGNFAGAAQAAGVSVKTTDLIGRDSVYPLVGKSAAVDAAIFALKTGETTAPIATDNAVVVARLKERQDIDPAKAPAERETLRADMLQEQRGAFFGAYMTKAKGKMKITFNEATIRAVVGS